MAPEKENHQQSAPAEEQTRWPGKKLAKIPEEAMMSCGVMTATQQRAAFSRDPSTVAMESENKQKVKTLVNVRSISSGKQASRANNMLPVLVVVVVVSSSLMASLMANLPNKHHQQPNHKFIQVAEAKMHHSKRQAPITSNQQQPVTVASAPTSTTGRESTNWWNLWWQQYIQEAVEPTVRPIVSVSYKDQGIKIGGKQQQLNADDQLDRTNMVAVAGERNRPAEYQVDGNLEVDEDIDNSDTRSRQGQYSDRLRLAAQDGDGETPFPAKQALLAHKKSMQHQAHWQSVKPTIIQPMQRDGRANRQTTVRQVQATEEPEANFGIQMRNSQMRQQPSWRQKQQPSFERNFQQQVLDGERFEQQQNQMIDYTEEAEIDPQSPTNDENDQDRPRAKGVDSSSSSMMADPSRKPSIAIAPSRGNGQRQQQPMQTTTMASETPASTTTTTLKPNDESGRTTVAEQQAKTETSAPTTSTTAQTQPPTTGASMTTVNNNVPADSNETPNPLGPRDSSSRGTGTTTGRVQLENGRPANDMRQVGVTSAARAPTTTTAGTTQQQQTTTTTTAATTAAPTTAAGNTTPAPTTTTTAASASTTLPPQTTTRAQTQPPQTTTPAPPTAETTARASTAPGVENESTTTTRGSAERPEATTTTTTAPQSTTTSVSAAATTLATPTETEGTNTVDAKSSVAPTESAPTSGTEVETATGETETSDDGDDEDEEDGTGTSASGDEAATTTPTPAASNTSSPVTTTTTQSPTAATVDLARLPKGPQTTTTTTMTGMNLMREASMQQPQTNPQESDITRIRPATMSTSARVVNQEDTDKVMTTLGRMPVGDETAITMPMETLVDLMNQVNKEQESSTAARRRLQPPPTTQMPKTSIPAQTSLIDAGATGPSGSSDSAPLPKMVMVSVQSPMGLAPGADDGRTEMMNLDLMPIQRIMNNQMVMMLREKPSESRIPDDVASANQQLDKEAPVEPGMRLRPPKTQPLEMTKGKQMQQQQQPAIVMGNQNPANTVYMIMMGSGNDDARRPRPPVPMTTQAQMPTTAAAPTTTMRERLMTTKSAPLATTFQTTTTTTTSRVPTTTLDIGRQTTSKTAPTIVSTTTGPTTGRPRFAETMMSMTEMEIERQREQAENAQGRLAMSGSEQQTAGPMATTKSARLQQATTIADTPVPSTQRPTTPANESKDATTRGEQSKTTLGSTNAPTTAAPTTVAPAVTSTLAPTTTTTSAAPTTTTIVVSSTSTQESDQDAGVSTSQAPTTTNAQQQTTQQATGTTVRQPESMTTTNFPTTPRLSATTMKLAPLIATTTTAGSQSPSTTTGTTSTGSTSAPAASKTGSLKTGKVGRQSNQTSSSFIPTKLRTDFNRLNRTKTNEAPSTTPSPLTGMAIRQFGGANRMSLLGKQPVPFGRPAAMTMQSGSPSRLQVGTNYRVELPTFEYGPAIAVRRPDEPLANGQVPNCTLTGKNFCVLTKDYPMNEVRQAVERSFRSVRIMYEELQTVSDQELHKDDFNATNQAASGKFACQTQVEMMRPGWAKDEITKEWMLVVNTDVFPQRVRTESCAQPNTPCEFIAPFYDSTCQQRYSLHRMIAIDPHDPSRSPQVAVFRFPAGCVCRVHPIRKTTTTTPITRR